MNDIKRNLGYRIKLSQTQISNTAESGGNLDLQIRLINTGWAAPYNPRNVELILRSKTQAGIQYIFPLNTDPRFWLPNKTIEINSSIVLPQNMPLGEYDALLNLPDSSSKLKTRAEYSIRLANKNTWENNTGYNKLLTTVTISQATSVDLSIDENSTKIFPNPTSGKIHIPTSEFKVLNMIGETILEGYSDEINIENFTNGIYYLVIQGSRYKVLKQNE
jgi:hypothetical protein